MKPFTPKSQPTKKNRIVPVVVVLTILILILMLTSHNWDTPVPAKPKLDETLPDFSQIQPVSERKQAFFDYLRPYIRQENQKIRYDRAFLESVTSDMSANSHHDNANMRKLRRMAKRYYYEVKDIDEAINELRQRIDIIPESLVLVQAANESAWGSSRFARDANNLFGQWCFSEGCGLVPKNRNAGARHEVRLFATPQASIVSYMRNLNSHSAYQEMRDIRLDLRNRGAEVSGVKLAQGLLNYSERRQEYVEELVSMIKQNRLE